MIVEIRTGRAFASDKGLAITQKASVQDDGRRYIMERARSIDKTFEEDTANWREATEEELGAWRQKLAEELEKLEEGDAQYE